MTFKIVIITNFVVVSCVGKKRVDCICIWLKGPFPFCVLGHFILTLLAISAKKINQTLPILNFQ